MAESEKQGIFGLTQTALTGWKERQGKKMDEELSGVNLNKTLLHVNHSELKRDGDSVFKSVCPTCKEGILLVTRDQHTLQLLEQDHCTLCGQAFIYDDIDMLKGHENAPD